MLKSIYEEGEEKPFVKHVGKLIIHASTATSPPTLGRAASCYMRFYRNGVARPTGKEVRLRGKKKVGEGVCGG